MDITIISGKKLNSKIEQIFVSTNATYSSSKIKQTSTKIKNKKLQNELNFNPNQN